MRCDIPIIFSAPMIRALLEGRKTMTRRIVSLANCEFGSFGAGKAAKIFWREHAAWEAAWIDHGFPDKAGAHRGGHLHVPCHDDDAGRGYCTHCQAYGWAGTSHRLRPKVQVGDRLWVRESHRLTDCDCTEACRGPGHIWYEATEEGYRNVSGNKLRPSIHMPRWASRITLIVNTVKIQRLQDISEADAIAEGSQTPLGELPSAARKAAWSERQAFAHIWDAINGAGAWNANPFVVVTSFRVIKANIDAPEARIAA